MEEGERDADITSGEDETPAPTESVSSSPVRGLKRHPSQATMWYTTVPQSLVQQNLGSRHAPTRRSLRHSRMVVNSNSSELIRNVIVGK